MRTSSESAKPKVLFMHLHFKGPLGEIEGLCISGGCCIEQGVGAGRLHGERRWHGSPAAPTAQGRAADRLRWVGTQSGAGGGGGDGLVCLGFPLGVPGSKGGWKKGAAPIGCTLTFLPQKFSFDKVLGPCSIYGWCTIVYYTKKTNLLPKSRNLCDRLHSDSNFKRKSTEERLVPHPSTMYSWHALALVALCASSAAGTPCHGLPTFALYRHIASPVHDGEAS